MRVYPRLSHLFRSIFVAVGLLVAPSSGALADGDLTVGWISRNPRIDFVQHSANPSVEGWPAPGQQVQWVAHVKNWSSSSRKGVQYRWLLDDETVSTGTVDLPGRSYVTVEYPWNWTFERHRVTFTIDSDDRVAEESETNNSLTVFTDALAVGLWVEQSLYDFFRANQYRLGIGSTCWENWAQRHIEWFNVMARLAVYPEAPDGVLDRMRLDEIVVVPDGALPLTPLDPGELPNSHPDKSDRTVDMQWGLTANQVGWYTIGGPPNPTNTFYLEGSLIHELGHARYLIDVYTGTLRHLPPQHVIDLRNASGEPVAGTEAMPGTTVLTPDGTGYIVHFTPYRGLMNTQYTWIDRYSTIALNRIAGHRATAGNANEPENIGEFMSDLPVENRLTIRNPDGTVVANAEVRIYQAVRWDPTDLYSRLYDDVPDLVLRTDEEGRVEVGQNPFSSIGSPEHSRISEDVAIVAVEKDGLVRYGFLELFAFNLAYWGGHTELADYDLVLGADPCPSGSGGFMGLWSPVFGSNVISNRVTLRWSQVNGAEYYTVWIAADGAAPQIAGTTTSTDLEVTTGGDVWWWVSVAVPNCEGIRSPVGHFIAPALAPPPDFGESRRRAIRRP